MTSSRRRLAGTAIVLCVALSTAAGSQTMPPAAAPDGVSGQATATVQPKQLPLSGGERRTPADVVGWGELTPWVSPFASFGGGQDRFGKALIARSEPRVSLDLVNVGARDAFRKVFAQAGQEYTIDADVPNEPMILLRAPNVRLTTAIKVLAETSGVCCTVTSRPGRAGDGPLYVLRYHVSRYPVPSALIIPNGTGAIGPDLGASIVGHILPASAGGFQPDLIHIEPFQLPDHETIACPHCHREITVIRPAAQPRCAKCGRLFEKDWQFCPADGTKRPAGVSELRFCPFCGESLERHADAA